MSKRVFGHISGVPVGSTFENRTELSKSGVHRPVQAGISGSQYEGADSIVLSGGYEDDFDKGDIIVYTGHGGNDPRTGEQIDHQTYDRGNYALAISQKEGYPVRLVRGAHSGNPYAPTSGYRYDGLYRVVSHWCETGKSGFNIWRFRLVTLDEKQMSAEIPPTGEQEPSHQVQRVTRVLRSTSVADWVKRLYNYRCQVCGLSIETPAGPYAEAAHIRPLGQGHDGADTPDNVLCLCPNHHVMFDYHAFTIEDDFRLVGEATEHQLIVDASHHIDPANLAYHREQYRVKHLPT